MDTSILYQKRIAFQSRGLFSKQELNLFWLWKDLPVDIILLEFEHAHSINPYHFTIKRNLNDIIKLSNILKVVSSKLTSSVFIEFEFFYYFNNQNLF
jgi:hypothetical protein